MNASNRGFLAVMGQIGIIHYTQGIAQNRPEIVPLDRMADIDWNNDYIILDNDNTEAQSKALPRMLLEKKRKWNNRKVEKEFRTRK